MMGNEMSGQFLEKENNHSSSKILFWGIMVLVSLWHVQRYKGYKKYMISTPTLIFNTALE